ncbi:hypothetical protein FWJ32_04505 [Calorimonas adulescens]|uniref:Uncharacterized protein n=1 Tax=Calorimonas adulescens TaxID=2606906 RepID=A0A5D8QED6_9THEO|nr:hypothetical protein FWJ32_04505 [Calorimonas adulescens]
MLDGKLRFDSLQIDCEGEIGVWLISGKGDEDEDYVKLPKDELENIVSSLNNYLEASRKK